MFQRQNQAPADFDSPLMSERIVPSRDAIRSWFPALSNEFAYLENAGGSQVPGCVANAIRDYMLTDYVQLGAGYAQSQRATQTVADAHAFAEQIVGAGTAGKVVLGNSTTALIQIIAGSYADIWTPGDEVVVAATNHEANAGAWAKLAQMGVVVRIWDVDPDTFQCSLESLRALLNDRTRIVAFPHVSNLLGEVVDVSAITELAHAHGAKVFVDGVAYAPHRTIDVEKWGVDWYVFSWYKVYGPHMAALFGRHEAFAELTGPNHFFIPRESIPYKFELGSISHEGCAGLLSLRDYFAFLAGEPWKGRETVIRAFEGIAELELPLQVRFLQFLRQKSRVRIIGLGAETEQSVGTISFVHADLTPSQIVAEVDQHNIGIRYGNMYAVRLCSSLGIELEEGVVRVSLVHYNTPEEIDRLISVLDKVL